jgi:hypothetical protein
MKFPWHSDNKKKAADGVAGGSYASESVVESRIVPGVRFTIAKMSFGRRVELMRLAVDGSAAGPELLAEAGPEELFREALAAVQRETGLSEEERKNS